VGNKTIDDQHKELVKLTNEFYKDCKTNGLAKAYFIKTIQGAVNYIKTHFSTEEEILRKVEYPVYDIHKKMHEDFIVKVVEQVHMLGKKDNPDPVGFVRFLMEWVVKHIAHADKLYTPYLVKLEH
jgi:hemerythrin